MREIAVHLGVKPSRIPQDIADLDDEYLSDLVSMLVFDDARRRHAEEIRKRDRDKAPKPMPIRRR